MTRSPFFWLQTLLVPFLCMGIVTAQPLDQNAKNTAFDIVIANGTVLDGSGLASFKADIGLHGDTIAAMGDLSDFPRSRTIDAAKLFVAPGFVDMHNHSDQTLLDEPRCESMIRQGVTTMVLGEGNHGPHSVDISNTSKSKESLLTFVPTSDSLKFGPTLRVTNSNLQPIHS